MNCKVEAINEWASLSDPTDISDGHGFMWVGKTQHTIKELKTNVIFTSILMIIGGTEGRIALYSVPSWDLQP